MVRMWMHSSYAPFVMENNSNLARARLCALFRYSEKKRPPWSDDQKVELECPKNLEDRFIDSIYMCGAVRCDVMQRYVICDMWSMKY